MEDYIQLIQAFSSPKNEDQQMASEFVRQHNNQAAFYENLLTVVCKEDFNSL